MIFVPGGKMKIEIVEFYLHSINATDGSFKGTLHVYLCDIQMDLRGIVVTKIPGKPKLHFNIPRKSDTVDGKKVLYPIVSFTDLNKNRLLSQAVRKQGTEYVEKFMDDFNKAKK